MWLLLLNMGFYDMENICLKSIVKYDQNLLITLYLLLKFRHVSETANQLCISQSAVSQQLTKLRSIFNDNLLVRTNNEMILTSFAVQLIPLLENIFENSVEIFNTINNDGKPTKMHYRLCMVDGVAMDKVSSILLNLTHKYDKKVSFEILSRYDDCVNSMNQGKLDFLIGNFNGLSNNIYQAKLGKLSYSLYVRKDHPLALLNRLVSIKDVQQYGFVDFKFHGQVGSEISNKYYQLTSKMNVVLSFSQYNSLVSILKVSDCIGFLPNGFVDTAELVCLNTLEVIPQGDCYIYWHSLMEHDVFHRYLRRDLIQQAKDLFHERSKYM